MTPMIAPQNDELKPVIESSPRTSQVQLMENKKKLLLYLTNLK